MKRRMRVYFVSMGGVVEGMSCLGHFSSKPSTLGRGGGAVERVYRL